jgi:hypothetical protein
MLDHIAYYSQAFCSSPTMPIQPSHFLRLPVELRLIVYELIFDNPRDIVLHHPLAYVSDQISEEVLSILLPRFSGFFWTAIPCHEEWYLALQPRNKVWRMRLTNVSELPLETVPTLHTKVSFHLLVGRRLFLSDDLSGRIRRSYATCKLDCGFVFRLEEDDQHDGVKRLVRDSPYDWHAFGGLDIWIERGRAGALEMNKKLTERVWHQQWDGGKRRGPLTARLCRLEVDASETGRTS